jgi:hypothetical protein
MVDPKDSQKLAKVDLKCDRKPSKKLMVVELAIDFRLQFKTDRKFIGRKEMQE